MKRILLALGLLIGSIGGASAACVAPVVMHDFPGSTFNMSVLTAPDGNCASATAVQTWAGQTLGAPSAYGTSPGAVLVPGVNAFITNTPAVSQSGTWNITNLSGTVSLPTGASTSALQTTGNTSLSSIDTKTPALGQALAAASVPVILPAATITTLTPPTSVGISGTLPAFASTPTFNCGTGCSSTGGTFNNNSDGVATSATNGQSAAWLYGFNGTTWDRIRGDTTNGMWANIKSSVLPTGAATAAGLTTINTTLGSPMQQTGGSVAPSTLAAWGLVASTQNGATPTNGQLAMGQFNTTPTTITSGNVSPLQLDSSGNMKVNVVAGGAGGGAVFGPTAVGSANANPPVVTGGTVTGAAGQNVVGVAIKPASTAAAATDTSIVVQENPNSALIAAVNSPIPNGTNTIGKVGIDQSTPGTTNLVALAANQSVNLAQVNGAAVPVGSGVQATAQRMTLATDSPGIIATVSNASSGVATGSTSVPTVGYNYGFNGTTWDQLQVDGSKFLKVNCAAGCTGASDTTAALSGMTALNAATAVNLVGTNSVGVLLSGTWVGTLTPEVSADGGTTWTATQFYNPNTHAAAATVTANGTYEILGTGGMSQARVRLSAFTSGTVTGNLKAVAQSASANDAQTQTNALLAAATPAGTNIIGKVGIDQTTPGTTNGVQVNAALPAGTNVIGHVIADTGSTTAVTALPAIPTGSNVIGKVSIDQTTPGTTNLVALAANQSVNQTQINGNAIATGSGVMGTGTQRMALATDSPGIVTLGQTTKSASVPVAIASDQGSIGALSSQYPSGATPITASATGTTAATTATLAATASVTNYICGFSMRSVATAAAAGNATVTGTISGTLNFTHGTGATPTVIPNDQRFNPCIPASAVNTAIAVVSPAAGTGGVMSVTVWGYRL